MSPTDPKPRSLVRRAVVLLPLLLLAALPAFGAGEITGRVTGYVFDPTGAPLAEVPVSIHGSAIMQPLTATSGEDGRYEFPILPPGDDYVLEIDVPGFAPVKKGGVVVQLGQTTPVDIHLAVLTETNAVATYEIVEKVNPAMNPDSAQTGAVINSEKAEITPVYHQVQAMSSQVAGVGPGSNAPSTRGGFGRFGTYYVDGMNTTDVVDGSFTSPMNFDVVQNFEIATGGFDAQYNSLGLVNNVVTKSGSDNFTHDLNLTWSPPAFNGDQRVPSGQPSYIQDYTGTNTVAAPLTSYFSPVVNFGGPIVPGKLWFYASGQFNRSIKQTLLTNFYAPGGEVRQTTTYTTLERLKLTFQPDSKDIISVALNVDHNNIDNADGKPTTSDTGEYRVHRGGFFIVGNYDHTFSDNVLFQLQTGMTNKITNQDPEVLGISHYDSSNRVTTNSSGSFNHDAHQRFQFDPTLSFKLGEHQLKAGVQTSLMNDDNIIGYIGAQKFVDKGPASLIPGMNPLCDPNDKTTWSYCYQQVNYYNPLDNGSASPLETTGQVITAGVFIQDRWNVTRKLTIVPGLRFDVGHLTGVNGFATTLFGVGPRLSATYDVMGDRKSLITAHYGRSNDVGNVGLIQHFNPGLIAVTSNFSSGAFIPCSIGSTAPGCLTSGGLRQVDTNAVAPHVDEISLGFRKEALENTVFGINLDYRRYSNNWADQEINRIYDFSGTKVIGYANANQPGVSIMRAVTPDSAYRDYKGMDLTVEGTPGKWDLLASYTLSFTTGTVDNFFDGYLNNPRMTQFYEGYVADDRRHTLLGSISYSTPFGLDLGFRLQYRTGDPLWESFLNPADSSQNIYHSPRGTGFTYQGTSQNFNDPSTWVYLRDPDQFTFDAQARYNLGKALGWTTERMEVALYAFNLLNSLNATSLNSSYSQYTLQGTATGRQSPVQVELFLRIRN